VSRAPLINPVIPGPDTEETYRAFGHLIDQLEERFNRSGQVATIPLIGVAGDLHVYLIPRVGKDGFNLGRVSMALTANNLPDGSVRTLSADASNYWTFTLNRYFFNTSGVRTKRPIEGGSWNTSAVSIKPDSPFVLEIKQPLDPGDTLVLDIQTTGTAVAFSATVQVEEMFGPEE
jgi:hypothetical protein